MILGIAWIVTGVAYLVYSWRRLAGRRLWLARWAVLAFGILCFITGAASLMTSAKLAEHLNLNLFEILQAWIEGPKLSSIYQGIWVAAVQRLSSAVLYFATGAGMIFAFYHLDFLSRICSAACSSEPYGAETK